MWAFAQSANRTRPTIKRSEGTITPPGRKHQSNVPKLVRSCGTRYPGGKAGVLLILPPRRANRLSPALQMLVDQFPRNSYIVCRASHQLFFLYSDPVKNLSQTRSAHRLAQQLPPTRL